MMIYQKSTNTMESYDYRETAPGRSKMDMFKKEPEKSRTGNILPILQLDSSHLIRNSYISFEYRISSI